VQLATHPVGDSDGSASDPEMMMTPVPKTATGSTTTNGGNDRL